MILNNLRTALTGDSINVRVQDGKIAEIAPRPFSVKLGQANLKFKDAIVFPGLTNSHDHLDFNLFPSLGDRTYKNYTEWGRHIHKTYGDKINKVLKVPTVLREQWGVYKNLLNGITTVVNHGEKVKKHSQVISVYENCQCIHSVQFEKRWWLSLNNPLKRGLPVAIHAGEGIDQSSNKEIDTLISRNLLKRSIVGIHGVAMTESQARTFRALVWCPESNYFLLNRSAPIDRLKKHVTILFGTDSTLTGNWNMWEHIRRARKTGYMTDEELFATLTSNPASIWGLSNGDIALGKDADIVVARAKPGMSSAESFFNIDPEDILLVLHNGRVSLFDEELQSQLRDVNLDDFGRIFVKSRWKYLQGNLPTLMHQIEQYYPRVEFPVI